MSRYSLHRPRRHRAVSHRTATSTRLLPTPHSCLDHSLGLGIPLALSRVEACPEPRRRGSQERNGWGLLPSPPQHNTHYKRCPKALRLRLRSDQSSSRPLYGRSPDKTRHSLSKGPCQVRAPLTRRIRLASSGDAPERSVMSLPWAIAPPWAFAPFSDSPSLDLAGESEQSDNPRLKTNAPFKDSTVVTTGEHPTTNGGHGSPLLSLGMVEHFWWTGLPHTENFSGFVHIPSEVRGKDSTVVTIGEFRSTNGGHGSPLPSLWMVEHFWWTGLPHAEIFSGLVHIPSEVRGCRRAVADVEHPLERTPRIGTGVDAFSRNRPGPSIISLPLAHFPTGDDRPVAQGVGHPDWGVHTPPPPFYHSEAPRGISDLPAHPSPLSPHPTHERNRLLAHLPHPHPGKNQISPKTIKDHDCAHTSIKTPSPNIQQRSSRPP